MGDTSDSIPHCCNVHDSFRDGCMCFLTFVSCLNDFLNVCVCTSNGSGCGIVYIIFVDIKMLLCRIVE